jgi:hypothetical protein
LHPALYISLSNTIKINTSMDSEYSYGLPDANLFEELVGGLPRFEFTGCDNLHRLVRDFRNKSEYESVLFTSVPHPEFMQLYRDESLKLSNLLYIHETQTLRLRIMDEPPHEIAIARFTNLFLLKYTAMGIDAEIEDLGSPLLHMGTTSKKPDGCWTPKNKGYVTAALEVGLSETLRKLIADARLLLETPASHVRQVLLIKVQPTKAEILFQVWGTTSREQWESRTVRPKQGWQIQQVRAHLKDDNQIEVDGDFSISFLKLMERIPNPATPEGDILFTQNDLADIATRVWQSQGFLAQGSLAPHSAANQ